MKPASFAYVRPASVDEAIEQLGAAEGDVKVLAGGQSLVPLLNLRMARPDVLVDIGHLDELDFVDQRADGVVIGAVTRQRTIEQSRLVGQRCSLLRKALHHVGHLQIRNRGTIGGSLAHADPSAELPSAVIALDATLTAQSAAGKRDIPACEFFAGPYTTALGESEILTEIRIPGGGEPCAFVEFARRAGDFAVAGVAAVCRLEPGTGAVTHVRLVAAGAGPAPQRLSEAENLLQGNHLSTEVISAAADAAASEVDPPADINADAGYRRRLVSVLVKQALEEIRSEH